LNIKNKFIASLLVIFTFLNISSALAGMTDAKQKKTSDQCIIPDNTLSTLFGNKDNALVTMSSPFTSMAQNPNVENLLWLNDDIQNHGFYRINLEKKLKKVSVISISCEQLTPELLTILNASRKLLGKNIILNPTSHFMDDLGLSFDQIVEIHALAYKAIDKTMPEALYESFAELALHLEEASNIKSRTAQNKKYHLQTVFYSTTRALEDRHSVKYSGDRDTIQPLHYGKAVVSIPSNHIKGEIEQPFFSIKWLQSSEDHVLIQDVKEMSSQSFWDAIPNNKGGDVWEDSIIVYVHGYNVAFSSAIKRTGQMAYDFEYSGVPILFSWPSNASLLDYASDREDAIWSAGYFAEFLTQLKQKNPDTSIHIVAHSMGNQVLVNALNELSLKQDNKGIHFTSIILAAPDVDSEWFEFQLAPRIKNLATRWALYTSENDGALIASNKVNQAKRLGMPGSFIDNIDIIDTSGLNAAPWSIPESHSYYANKLPVIEDLVNHLKGIPPSQRGLIKNTTAQGITWAMQEE
jgi:esterase/lipase superfamily enzyme